VQAQPGACSDANYAALCLRRTALTLYAEVMRKIIKIFLSAFKGIEYFLNALDWIALGLIILMLVMALPLHFFLKYNRIDHPILATVAILFFVLLISYSVYFLLKKKKGT